MLELWERSVRATHHFLTEQDILTLRPLVAELFVESPVEFWVAANDSDLPFGFLGYTRDTIEALFIDPDFRGLGVGKSFVAHAQTLSGGALNVEVNEQNEAAVSFYTAQGFQLVSRSDVDSEGRPFPILRMQREAPATSQSGS